jgi:hypothetical protein
MKVEPPFGRRAVAGGGLFTVGLRIDPTQSSRSRGEHGQGEHADAWHKLSLYGRVPGQKLRNLFSV